MILYLTLMIENMKRLNLFPGINLPHPYSKSFNEFISNYSEAKKGNNMSLRHCFLEIMHECRLLFLFLNTFAYKTMFIHFVRVISGNF